MPSHLALCGLLPFSLLLSLPAFGSVSAQVIQGHLYDNETGEPIINGTVVLLKDLGTVVARTEADSLGAYSLIAPGPGMYSVRATGLGFISKPTLQFDVGEEGPITVNVYLHPEPIELDSLLVEAESQRIIPYLEWQGFYERLKEGWGYFITPEEIERRNPRHFSDLFRNIGQWTSRGLDLGPRCSGGGGRILIDGIPVSNPFGGILAIGDIQAVEVFRGLETPLQYGGRGCVVLIWTKGGRDTG